MDRDQQSRRQKSGAAAHSASRPKNRPPQRPRQTVPPKRGLGSRVGLEKRSAPSSARKNAPAGRAERAAPPRRELSVRGDAARQPSRTGQSSGQARQGRYRAAAGSAARPTQASRNPQSAAYRPGAPRQRRRVTQVEKMRIRRRRKILGVVCVLAVLALGVVLSINLLFKVTDFRVENTDRTTPANTGIYTEEQILELLGVQVGDNLFGFSTRQKSEELQAQLPYLDVVQVDIQMPGTVVIKVQPATERFAMQTSAGWLVLSDGLKVLRSDSSQPDGLILLEANLDPRQPQTPGSYLSLLDPSAQPATAETAESAAASRTDTVLAQLIDTLEQYSLLDGVTSISLTDLEEINFLYDGRVSVVLGTANNMDYKLRIASQIVLDVDGTGLASTDRGTLDVSIQRTDGSIVSYFTPAETTPAPTPTPTPDPAEDAGDAADGGTAAADDGAQTTPTPDAGGT